MVYIHVKCVESALEVQAIDLCLYTSRFGCPLTSFPSLASLSVVRLVRCSFALSCSLFPPAVYGCRGSSATNPAMPANAIATRNTSWMLSENLVRTSSRAASLRRPGSLTRSALLRMRESVSWDYKESGMDGNKGR